MNWLTALFIRLALVFIWLATPMVNHAFHRDWLIPLLGVILVPFTTLVYVLIAFFDNTMTGLDWFWIALALLADLWAHSSSPYARRGIPKYQ